MKYLLEAKDIRKEFHVGNTRVEVLKGLDFCVRANEFIAIMGPSGSGKSTLLNILGCLERPTSGSYFFAGREVAHCPDQEQSRIRARQIGFVFQSFNLLNQLTVLENVELPFLYSRIDSSESTRRAREAVDQVGLSHRLYHRPAELSGGEKQRVAIARVIAVRPTLILADEPTGNLDSATGAEVLRLFTTLHRQGTTLLMVTHDLQVAASAQRIVNFKDGYFA